MGLAEDFGALTPQHGGIRCAVAVILDEMSPEDRATFVGAMANPRLQGSGIARVLRQHGYHVGDGAVQRHRRRECLCR